jgi:hypothetical protein
MYSFLYFVEILRLGEINISFSDVDRSYFASTLQTWEERLITPCSSSDEFHHPLPTIARHSRASS